MTIDAAAIAARWAAVRARVDAACVAAGRAPDEVTLIAVAKTQPAAAIAAVVAAGARDIGENYAQELAGKRGELPDLAARWHYIGRLQRNKAKLVAGQVALVHAVDSLELAAELGKRTRAAGGDVQPLLIAVNLAGEATKGGVAAAEVEALAAAIDALPGVRLDGLMTLPPASDDAEASRPAFVALRALRDRLANATRRPWPVLSMGMSGDFEVAIACGATHVRVGTAIFGAR